MIGKVTNVFFFGFLLISCATERPNFSPTNSLLNQISANTLESAVRETSHNLELIKYTSEITNTFDEGNGISEESIQQEINQLKFYVSEYIFAVKEHNIVGREKSLYNYEKSYKKIQKLKNRLSPKEAEELNRFLVKIKTNINLIESLKNTL